MNFNECAMKPLTMETATQISQWEYESPYDVYNFKERPNGYLMDKTTWGVEQFCLAYNNEVVGQVACQYDGNTLWVGWSLSPTLCGKGNGHLFIQKCVEEIRKIKNYDGGLYLRVSANNKRAIEAYKNAGFVYVETIQDTVAYTNHVEDFWVMVAK